MAREELEELGFKPLWIVRLIAGRPITLSCSILFFLLACAGVIAGIRGADFFTPTRQRDFLVYPDPLVIREDSLSTAQLAVSASAGGGQIPPQSKSISLWDVVALYDCPLGNCLAYETLQHIKKFEARIKDESKGYEKFCFMGLSYPNCSTDPVKPSSISLLDIYGAAEDQATIDWLSVNVVAKLPGLGGMLGREFDPPLVNTSKHLRSFFFFGAPIRKSDGSQFRDESDDFTYGQLPIFREWQTDLLDDIENFEKSDLKILMLGNTVFDIVFERVTNSDTLFAVGSVVFVFFYMWFHTKSVFLTAAGISGILLAFPLTMMFYFIVFDIDFFQTIHTLTVFVILGIGADDIFVFIDAWNQAPASIGPRASDLVQRMDWTYRRAVKAMFVTSFTTVAAFMATAISTIMPISSFGIFAGVLVACNYLVVITLFPCAVIIWEKNFRHTCCNKPKEPTTTPAIEQEQEVEMVAMDLNATAAEVDDSEAAVTASGVVVHDVSQYNPIERFFHVWWTEIIFKGRIPILIFFVALLATAGYFSSQLSPLTKEESFLPADHPWQKAVALNEDGFKASVEGRVVRINMVWGVQGLDQSESNRYDPSHAGSIIWDTDFDLSRPASQLFLNQTCGELRDSSLVLNRGVQCPIDDYRLWREASGLDFPALFSSDRAEQLRNFTADMQVFLATTPAGLAHAQSKLVGIDSADVLRYHVVVAVTSRTPFQPERYTRPYWQKWENVVNDINSRAPPNLPPAFFTAFSFAWMATEVAFVQNAIQGISISVAIAMIILILSTGNLLIGLYATVTIVGIVSSVMMTVQLKGWELGLAESVAVVILIGFSVDYVVHLGNSYTESVRTDRKGRMQDALRDMGISVASGAFTTFGASVFLHGTTGIFFLKFAWLMGWTVFFSLLWSLVFFSALAMTLGPEGDLCSLHTAACCQKCKRS